MPRRRVLAIRVENVVTIVDQTKHDEIGPPPFYRTVSSPYTFFFWYNRFIHRGFRSVDIFRSELSSWENDHIEIASGKFLQNHGGVCWGWIWYVFFLYVSFFIRANWMGNMCGALMWILIYQRLDRIVLPLSTCWSGFHLARSENPRSLSYIGDVLI